MDMLFRPQHILLAPLNHTSVSLAACIVLGLLQRSASLELFHLSVIAPLQHPESVSPSFDIVQSTVEVLLEADRVSVLHDITSLEGIAWVLDLSLDSVQLRREYYSRNRHLNNVKILYVRPVELADNADVVLCDNEVLLTYSLLVEDLPYFPLSLGPLATTSSVSSKLLTQHTTLYPLPLHSLSLCIIELLSSRFIYQQRYNITGPAFVFPPRSEDSATPVDPGIVPIALAADADHPRFHSRECHDNNSIYSDASCLSDISTPPPSIHSSQVAPNSLSHTLIIESSGEMFIPLGASSLHVALADLRSPSGRPLKSLLAGLRAGVFEKYSPDWKALMHRQLPELVLVDAPSYDEDNGDQPYNALHKHPTFHSPTPDVLPICGGRYYVAVYTPGGEDDSSDHFS